MQEARKKFSVNGARQERSTTVSRGRVHMWTRLSTYHAPRGGEKKVEAGRDGVQHVHNGYVRQGWILLINPTGYIVPPARDGHTASSYPVSFPKTRSSSLVHGRCSSAARSVPRPSILRFYEKAVSFYRDELCRREYRAGRCASLLYHSHYARLRQRRYRSAVTVRRPARPVSSV